MTESITQIKSYERQKLETDKEWYCFTCYRDLGYARSPRRVAMHLNLSSTEIGQMAERWRWTERIYEWDLETDRTKRTLIINNIEAMRERHKHLSQRILRFSAEQIEKYIVAFSKEEMPMVKIPDLVRLIDAAAKLERSTYGEPDLVVKVKGDRENMRELFEDQAALAVIDGLVERIQKKEVTGAAEVADDR